VRNTRRAFSETLRFVESRPNLQRTRLADIAYTK